MVASTSDYDLIESRLILIKKLTYFNSSDFVRFFTGGLYILILAIHAEKPFVAISYGSKSILTGLLVIPWVKVKNLEKPKNLFLV